MQLAVRFGGQFATLQKQKPMDENAVRTHNFHARIRVSAGERGALIFLLAYFRVFASHV
jgi:hypothetical protein